MSQKLVYSFWDYLLPVVDIFFVVWYIAFWGITLIGWKTTRTIYTRRPRSPLATQPQESVPGVSVIRPLKGLDPNLYENLESSFLQEYPNFELIFSVQDPEDAALRVVNDLRERYPLVNVQVIKGEEIVGVNPKVNNLVKPFRQAKNDILWVLDSNVQVDRGTMARSVDALTREFPAPENQPAIVRTKFRERVGVVHHVPFAHVYTGRGTLGSHLERAFLNTTHAKMYVAINKLAIDSCVMGKSNMYRRSDIERLTALPSSRGQYKNQKPALNGEPEFPTYPPEVQTGLKAFGEFLAEDNMIAAAIWHELGLLHDLSCDVAINALGEMSVRDYISRRIRWIRVRKHMVLAATLIEPLTECLALCILGAWAIARPFGIPIWLFSLTHIAAWLSLDLSVYAALAGHPLPSNEWWFFVGAWALRELLAFPIWLVGVVGSEVSWRGTSYRVLWSGKVQRVDSKTVSQRTYERVPDV